VRELIAGEGATEEVAKLRAEAFYTGLAERQELPFPPRFRGTFEREFASRELQSLERRLQAPVGNALETRCLIAVDPRSNAVLGCLDVSLRRAEESSTAFVYMDNVCVDPRERRRGIASSLLMAVSGAVWSLRAAAGVEEILTHVHAENDAALALYERHGFVAVVDERCEDAALRRDGESLELLCAPLPLATAALVSETAASNAVSN